ncbi:cysteine sulfinic acid decarboxylase-like [Daphnia carinata]|uniref:cysteine sulfinic acid decarboxylase-like n=1 Tax=Daphnia carinata TaxID=120202 RepID=UPI0025807C46|nr:cysteine sulfinic acid decarboxylase-like [Daphnia carinata]
MQKDNTNTVISHCKLNSETPTLMDRFQTKPSKDQHEQFIRQVIDVLLKEAVFQGTSNDSLVIEWMEPESLMALLGEELPKNPESDDNLIKLIKDVVRYSVKTGHPHFINQLFSSLDPYGLVAQWVTDSLNPSVYTYEVAPVFTLLEHKLLCEMRRYVGFPGGSGDGVFCPGGSMANIYGIQCARHHAMPDLKEKGTFASRRLVVLTSKDAHYSIKKACFLLGIGTSNLYLVDVDNDGRMNLAHLREEIQRALKEGARPFMVSATAGTTVLGSTDPLDGIADICQEFGLWMHVDAAWGGGALMSTKHRHILNGIQRADSVTWNPHKLLGVPQQCSTFLTRHLNLLLEANSASASYLFQKDKFYDPKWDVGDKYLQCGRRADVLKFWLMWQAKGSLGLERHVDTLFENAAYFTSFIRDREGFKLVLEEPSFVNVCFWYIPPSLRNSQHDEDYHEKLHRIAPKIKERMIKKGSMMITYQPLRNLPNFFRLVLQSSGVNTKDMEFFAEEIERLGCDL